jgi:heme oxygenase
MSHSQTTNPDGNSDTTAATTTATTAAPPNESETRPLLSSPALVLSVLKALRPHGLARSDRLRRDLATLLGINANEVDSFLQGVGSDATNAFVEHINQSVTEKPHLLIAYAFTLYLAIFSGGRWIRSLLAAPGRTFWSPDMSASASMEASIGHFESSVHERLRSFTMEQQECFEELGLAFWFFSSLNDGLDIKAEFKRRLEGAESLLTPQMKAEIVAEARDIFLRCEGLVGELDEFVGRQGNIVNGGKRSGATYKPKSSRMQKTQSKGWLGRAWKAGTTYGHRYDVHGYAALALVISSVSWYAMYHNGTWLA